MTGQPNSTLRVSSLSADSLGPLSVEIVPETGDNIEEFALSSAHQTQDVEIAPGRYAVIARRPNGDRLYRAVTVPPGQLAKVDLATNLPASPNEFMELETRRGEVKPGPVIKKRNERSGTVEGFARRSMEALSVARDVVGAPSRTLSTGRWTVRVWLSQNGRRSLASDANVLVGHGPSFLKIRTQPDFLAVGVLDDRGFGPIVMTPPFRKPIHVTFLAEALAARAAARYLNPSGQRTVVALVTPEEPAVADLLAALGSVAVEHAGDLWDQYSGHYTNALGYLKAKFNCPAEALLAGHYLLRYLPDRLPLSWADNLRHAFPQAADGPAIAAWLRLRSRAENVTAREPKQLHAEFRRFLEEALSRRIVWFARGRRLLVDGLNLEKPSPVSPRGQSDPKDYYDYGAHAGGLEAFWGAHPFSPGQRSRGSPPAHRDIAVIELAETAFGNVLPGTPIVSTARVRIRRLPPRGRVHTIAPDEMAPKQVRKRTAKKAAAKTAVKKKVAASTTRKKKSKSRTVSRAKTRKRARKR